MFLVCTLIIEMEAAIKNLIFTMAFLFLSAIVTEGSGYKTATLQDSVATNDNYRITLQLHESISNNLFYFDRVKYDQLMKFSYYWGDDVYFDTEAEEKIPGSLNMLKAKQNLIGALKMQNKFRMQKSLGLVGDILGYVNIAAVASLAVIHLNKYYWNEGKKENKKKTKK